MKICIFGTYDKNYTSNKLIISGLKQNNVDVLEVNAHTPVTRLDSKKEMTWLKILGRIIKKYKIFAKVIKNFRKLRETDAIYIGYPGHFDVFLAYPLAKLLRKKLVFNPLLIIYIGFSEEQGILNKKSLLGRAFKFTEGLAYKACDLVFADTPFQEKYFINNFGVPKEKLRILPIGADDKYYAYTPYTNLEKKINVVYYGLYSPVHGVEYIIEAANILRKDQDIKFTFVGIGQTFQKNFDRTKDLRLSNVEFFHNVPMEKHPAIIQKGDIFLGFLAKHPSVERIIPNKIYQGLSLGKVVLTADAPVTRSLFTHKKDMYMVEPANPKALAEAVLELKNDPKLRKAIADNGHDLFTREFTPKAVGKKMLEYIEGLALARARP